MGYFPTDEANSRTLNYKTTRRDEKHKLLKLCSNLNKRKTQDTRYNTSTPVNVEEMYCRS